MLKWLYNITNENRTWISILLKIFKKIGHEYYCEELFVVKSKTRYNCAITIYFNLESDIIKENCEFLYYYNKTDIKATMLDGGFQIILANWPNYRKIMCSHNNNILINIPGHPYILMNRSICVTVLLKLKAISFWNHQQPTKAQKQNQI